ncbi:MAG: hypothetical protein RSG57_01740 [Christensenellaceae bacterium]
MTDEKAIDEIVQHGKQIARHDSEIKTLFNQQKSIEKIADSTNSLALSIEKIAGRIEDVDERLGCIEQDKKQKGFAVWQIVMSAVLGGVLTFLVSRLIG